MVFLFVRVCACVHVCVRGSEHASFNNYIVVFIRQHLASSIPVASVAYHGVLEPGIGQFRAFEPRRVHTRKISQIDLRKVRERDSAIFDENRRAVGVLNPVGEKR